jgi:mono/diheme cytochrome c family protein
MRKLSGLVLVVLTLGACTTAPISQRSAVGSPTTTKTDAAGSQASLRGLAFAQSHCAGCHAVTSGRASSNPEAPSFEAIVNTPGLTAATLGPWLRDSHNFPAMMDFAIAPDQIDDLAAHMLALQRSDYTPPIQ